MGLSPLSFAWHRGAADSFDLKKAVQQSLKNAVDKYRQSCLGFKVSSTHDCL